MSSTAQTPDVTRSARPPGTSTPPAVDAQELTKSYGDVPALRGVTFSVAPGTIFGLLGPNGAGKSTTVKILTTLSRADSGTARVAGLDVVREQDAVRQLIGCVAQKPGTDAMATTRENLLLQGRIYGLRGRPLAARADELLAAFGLSEAATRLAKTLSGGMARKLDVAMGLVHRPRVLFLDEPTTGLDPEARTEMWAEISRLASAEGLSILLTTHYLDEADRLADRVAIVDAGRVVVEGTPEELKSQLHGDAVVAELADPESAGVAVPLLRGMPGSSDVSVEGRVVRSRVDSGAQAVPRVLALLDQAGLVASSVTVARPSLDDVYLQHAGRAFASADAAGAR